MPESEGNDNQGTDSTQKEQPEAQSTSGTSEQWVDSTPNLEGDAKDLKDGQLTVVEFVTEKADNGGDASVYELTVLNSMTPVWKKKKSELGETELDDFTNTISAITACRSIIYPRASRARSITPRSCSYRRNRATTIIPKTTSADCRFIATALW